MNNKDLTATDLRFVAFEYLFFSYMKEQRSLEVALQNIEVYYGMWERLCREHGVDIPSDQHNKLKATMKNQVENNQVKRLKP